MTGLAIPLRDIYAAVFGAPPGSEVAATCDRLDIYLRHQPMGTASLMIVIALRPLDLFLAATTVAERQLRDAELAFDVRASGARSNEQHVIARMADAIGKLQQENDRLRTRLADGHPRRRRYGITLVAVPICLAAISAIAWVAR